MARNKNKNKTITTTTVVVVPQLDLPDLQQALIQTYHDLVAGKCSISHAKELNKVASNAIDIAKVQLANELVQPNRITTII